jgi:hypothetical protein
MVRVTPKFLVPWSLFLLLGSAGICIKPSLYVGTLQSGFEVVLKPLDLIISFLKFFTVTKGPLVVRLAYTGCGKLASFFHIALCAKKEVSLPHLVFSAHGQNIG